MFISLLEFAINGQIAYTLYLTAGDEMISFQLANDFSGVSKWLAFVVANDFRDQLLDTMVLTFVGQPKLRLD